MSHRIRLIATGGTIATHVDADGEETRRSGEELVAALDPAEAAGVDVDDLYSLESYDLTLDHLTTVASRARAAVAEGATGVVVTMGTDTMEETSFGLDLLLADIDAPIVVTGAMRLASDPEPDGPANLADAIRVACHPAAVGRGVLVVMHGEIHQARSVTKVDARRLDAFASYPEHHVGTVGGPHVELTGAAPPRPPRATALDPRVALLKVVPGMDPHLIEHVVDDGARGIVLEGYGTLHLPSSLTKAVSAAVEAGVVVVVASRAWADIRQDDDPGAGLVGAGDLSAAKARLALMAALGTSGDPRRIRAWFAATT